MAQMNPGELFRKETTLLQLSLDEIAAQATRELWTCGDFDTVQRANNAIIRGACLAAVESAFKHGRKAPRQERVRRRR